MPLTVDALGLVFAATVALVAVTVVVFARRYLDPGPARTRFAAGAGVVLAGSALLATADRLSLLVAAWVLTTIGVLIMVGQRRAVVALGLGDLALVAAAAAVLVRVGDPALGELGPALAADGLATPLAVALVLAALARAAQVPFPAWLPGTLNAPTPTSALLHAGVVNAGAILLIRTTGVLDAAPSALWVLGAASLASIVVWSGAALARPDTKGALAASTSAQMGFMLLAVAVGAPLAAMTHLVGHALYKSARFLGAGDALATATRRRRLAAHRAPLAGGARLAATATVTVAVAGSVLLVRPAVLHGAEAWMLGAAMAATVVHGAWSWLGRTHPSLGRATTVATLVLGGLTLGYLALAGALEALLAPSVAEVAVPAAVAPLALALLAAIVAGGAFAAHAPAVAPRLWGALATVGHPRPAASPNRVRRVPRRTRFAEPVPRTLQLNYARSAS